MHNIYIETYGCSANQNNTEIISGLLTRAGFNVVSNIKIADIFIINTCVVKGPTLQKMINRIKELSSKRYLIVSGCIVNSCLEKIKKIAPKACLLGTHNIKNIVFAVKKMLEGNRINLSDEKDEIKLCMPKINKNSIVGITQISEGCSGRCSFCFTRLAKGNLFSYPQEQIIKNIENDLQSGCKEIWLTSQDNATYGMDRNKKNERKSNLPELLEKIFLLKHKFMLRIGMMNPNNIALVLDKLIEQYKNKKIFKFLHMPLQSGSNKVLKDMNRKYTAEKAVKIVEKFRKQIPDMTLSTDIIIGYPTETDKDFNQTIDIIKKIKPDVINISKFCAMPNTKASRLKPLSLDIIKKRTAEMMMLHEKIAVEKNKALIGKTKECILDEKSYENTYICRTLEYKPIIVKADRKFFGKKVMVKINNAGKHYCAGEIIN